ncbi:acidic leucine-rich nuclear phosphoprotein 32 family member B-like isoform X1 [Siniperca chuatsi]|uniref:acidic leucine-rich nuclear phosphoprotein 32 family member B-like isoform X1 n=1 Tax=Siniperca chuatsi TaxID=119488 RepID=UPI001CE16AA8|nr:acidic leucine-rich nuclear phosphoprotein 32 family member B-like isoform X1 [Siniperca chuatsi]
MNGQGDGLSVVQNIFIFFRQPVFGVLGPVDMNFPQGHGMVADEDPGHLDRNSNDDNINDHNVENVGPGAEVDIGINQHIEQEDPLPGGSRRRPREEDEEDSSKRFRWWDECTDCDWDSCFDSDVSSIVSEDSDEDDIVAEEKEEDPLPGATRKREREEEDKDDEDDIVEEEVDPLAGVSRKRGRDEEDEDERSIKKSRWL